MPQTSTFVYRSLLLVSLVSCAGGLTAQTNALQQQVSFAVNKNTQDAVPVKKTYDDDAKSWYAVYNTANTIHVYIAVTDARQQRKIIMNGIELWIDTKGKKNKKTGIVYPFTSTDNKAKPPMQPSQAEGRRPDFFAAHERNDSVNVPEMEAIIAQHNEMKLIGFKEALNGLQNNHHPSGIDVSLHFIKDTLLYEAQLPLNTLAEMPLVNLHVSVGIIEKGMGLPEQNGNGMPPPDGGGDGGMMPPPGGLPPGGEDGMRIFEDNIIWYKFSLQDLAFVK